MKQITKILLAGFMALAMPVVGSMDKPDRPNRGWHWYDLEPEIVEAIKEEIERQVEVKVAKSLQEQSPPQPEVGSNAWISENLPKFRARAGDNPTSDNIRALLYLERVLIDRAATLGRRAAMVAQTDPYLDTSYKPTANMHSARAFRRNMSSKESEVVDRLVKDGLAIWAFIAPDCFSCVQQIKALGQITRNYGVPVLFILMDGAEAPIYEHEQNVGLWEHIIDDGHSDLFPLLTIPTSYAYDNNSGEYILVSQGFSTMDMFIERTLTAADYAGWATPQEIESVRFGNDVVNLGLFDFSQSEGDMTEASIFLKYMENKLMGDSNE